MNLFQTLTGVLVLVGLVHAQSVSATATGTVDVEQAEATYVRQVLYPLSTCVVSDEELEGDSVKSFEIDGRLFKTCCGKCQKKVEADPATFAARLDAALVARQLKTYPLDACVVTGRKLGSKGDPTKLVLDGTLIQLCCEGCTEKATANGAAMVAKVHDAAFAAQLASYPTKTCIVSDEKLGDDATDVMYGTTLVRLCCEGCGDDFEQDPTRFLEKLTALKGGAIGGSAAAADCGTECIQGLTGGCCGETAAPAAKTAPVKESGGCCSETAAPAAKTAPVKASGGCCDETSAPAKKVD